MDLQVEQHATFRLQEKLGADAVLEARKASDDEHRESVWQSLKANRKAVAWSVMVSMSVVMEGYDTILIGSFYGYPEFRKHYGTFLDEANGYQISTPWQTGLGMASTVGAVFGGILNGQLCARYGYRWIMIISLFFMAAFVFIVFFATSLPVLLVGEILCGFSWGVFATVGPAYASEVCPTQLRAYLTTYVNICWAIGQLVAAGVLQGLITRPDEWAYRIPFALQWMWPIPLGVGCFLMPESPWYLVQRDRLDDALRSLRRLTTGRDDAALQGQLAMMVHTAQIETQTTGGATYVECFRGTDLRRTEIACLAFAGQILSGSTFAYSPSYFFEQAGLADSAAYKLNLGCTAIALLGTIASWWFVSMTGRRTLYLAGQSSTLALLLLIGIVSVSSTAGGALWGQAALCILWILCYSLTLGPIAYSFISEISSTRLRPLTVCLARTFYQLVNIVSQVVEPQFMNPTALNAKGKTAFFWSGTSLIMLVWAYFRLPEPRGRTYEELDLLFARKVPARKFATTVVDAYDHLDAAALGKSVEAPPEAEVHQHEGSHEETTGHAENKS